MTLWLSLVSSLMYLPLTVLLLPTSSFRPLRTPGLPPLLLRPFLQFRLRDPRLPVELLTHTMSGFDPKRTGRVIPVVGVTSKRPPFFLPQINVPLVVSLNPSSVNSRLEGLPNECSFPKFSVPNM